MQNYDQKIPAKQTGNADWPALRGLRLSDEQLKIISMAAHLEKVTRGRRGRVYHKLRYRDAGLAKSIYVSKERVEAVAAELERLQEPHRRRLELKKDFRRLSDSIRSIRRETIPVLEQRGYHYHGMQIRKTRVRRSQLFTFFKCTEATMDESVQVPEDCSDLSADESCLSQDSAPMADAVSDEYLQFGAAIAAYRADSVRDASPSATLISLAAADLFERHQECTKKSRRAKRDGDGESTHDLLQWEHLGLKAAKQGTQMVRWVEQIRGNGQK